MTTDQSSATVLVTGAGGPLGVNFVRSLRIASRGWRVVGTDANRWHLPLSLADQTYLIPLARELDAYAEALNTVIEKEQVRVLVPTHPVEVRAVAELVAQGRLAAATCLPSISVLDTCDDKTRTQARLAQAGVAVPAMSLLATPQDVEAAFSQLGPGPVWVRGSGAPGLGIGGAALPCTDPKVAIAWIEHYRGWGGMSAWEYLPGANLTWMAVFHEGELLAAGSRERLEYVLPHVSPSGVTGAPAVSRTIARADVAETGLAAVRAVDDTPHGAYFVDMKEDAEGVPRVTEINAGRCGTTVHFYSKAGFNFPELLVDLASGSERDALAQPNSAVEPDLYWVRTLDCGPELVRGDAGFDGFPRAGVS